MSSVSMRLPVLLAQVEHGDDVGVGTQASHGLGLPVNPGHAYQPIIAPPHQKPTPNLGFHFVSRYWGVITGREPNVGQRNMP